VQTVQILDVLYALINNPYCENALFATNMVDSIVFSADDDAIFFQNILFSQFANELVICGAIVDSLAVQSSGLH
jgi:hypothetical protein